MSQSFKRLVQIPNRCTFVLHFGKLTTSDRQWLRQWSIRNATQFITIDETLVLYLSSIPSGALRAMFDCTLPFTCTEPFFTAPGLVPPESFFGRESERRSIIDRFGSCFVYGGRQLGKTALLHAAASCVPRSERPPAGKMYRLESTRHWRRVWRRPHLARPLERVRRIWNRAP